MRFFDVEKNYLVNGIIGLVTTIIVVPIALFHFSINSTIFSKLVPFICIGSLVSWFSFKVYSKGRYRLYKNSLLNSRKLLIILSINILVILNILR